MVYMFEYISVAMIDKPLPKLPTEHAEEVIEKMDVTENDSHSVNTGTVTKPKSPSNVELLSGLDMSGCSSPKNEHARKESDMEETQDLCLTVEGGPTTRTGEPETVVKVKHNTSPPPPDHGEMHALRSKREAAVSKSKSQTNTQVVHNVRKGQQKQEGHFDFVNDLIKTEAARVSPTKSDSLKNSEQTVSRRKENSKENSKEMCSTPKPETDSATMELSDSPVF